MRKFFISSLLISLLISSNVFALNISPIVKYPDDGRSFEYESKDMYPPYTTYYDILNRPLIFKNEAELRRNTLFAFGGFVKIVKRDLPNIYSQKYSMVSVMPFPNYRGVTLNLQKKQVSIFVNGEIIGYYVLAPVSIGKPDSDLTYTKMKALSLNTNYLSGRYTIPPRTQIKTYEVEHSGYIERYITFVEYVKEVKEEYLFAEIFYPKEIDGEFDSKIIDAINTYSYRIDKTIKVEEGYIPFSEIGQEFMTPLGDTEY
ncbi:MAG: hypothetical protein U0354_09135 [Candidatus Sericytochromatia bacterium]